jgi:chromosome segregation ATPase
MNRLDKMVTKLRQVKEDLARSEGKLDVHLRTLRDKYQAKDLDDAIAKLERFREKLKRLEEEAEVKYAAFMAKWGSRLEESDK